MTDRNALAPISDDGGVNIDRHQRANVSVATPGFFDERDLAASLKRELEGVTLGGGEFVVGKTRAARSETYIDVMGASTDPNKAALYARHLSTYWKYSLLHETSIRSPSVDFVVTPKEGSPFLGYEFAKIMRLPIALHVLDPKFSGDGRPESRLDWLHPLPSEATALIVDDSTTGGRKVLAAAEELRRLGYNVTDCLVLFEPVIKEARALLAGSGIALHSIMKLEPRH